MEAMHFRRWLNIKVYLKKDEFWTEKKKTDGGYSNAEILPGMGCHDPQHESAN